MTIKQSLNKAIGKLKKKKIKSAELDAEILLSFVLKKPRSYIYIWSDESITKIQDKRYKRLIERRAKNEPVAYITHKKEFYGLGFYVDKNVLIPRPETEHLVEEIIKVAAAREPQLRIADIGTGSGCIAITLKKFLPKAKIYASDFSTKAIMVAKRNARKYHVKIIFREGDLLETFRKINLKLIVANLPYLDPKWFKKESIRFEPQIAKGAGEKGVDLYKRFFEQIKKYFPKAKVIIEIDPRQIINIKKIIKGFLPKAKLKLIKDLAGHNRVIAVN